MTGTDTLPRLLGRNAARWPNRPAWRHKRLGIWQTQTWSSFAKRTDDIALGLAERGFGHGDRLAVLGDNRPDLYAALIAAQALGGVGVPLDPDASPERLAAILRDAAVSIVVTDTMEQVDRLRPVAAPVRVFCVDTSGFRGREAGELATLDTLAAAGHDHARREPTLLAASVAQGAARDLALLIYPSDASADTGPASRRLALSHAQILAAAEAIAAADPVRPTDNAVCYLPMASYADAAYSLALGLLGGFTCNCPETPDSVLLDLREIGPTILFAPPAACAALARLVGAKAGAITGFKRRSFDFFQGRALRADALREQRKPIPPGLRLACHIGELLTYAPVRDQLGLSRARWVHADVPATPEAARLLRALGVKLRPGTGRAADPAPACEAHETQHA